MRRLFIFFTLTVSLLFTSNSFAEHMCLELTLDGKKEFDTRARDYAITSGFTFEEAEEFATNNYKDSSDQCIMFRLIALKEELYPRGHNVTLSILIAEENFGAERLAKAGILIKRSENGDFIGIDLSGLLETEKIFGADLIKKIYGISIARNSKGNLVDIKVN